MKKGFFRLFLCATLAATLLPSCIKTMHDPCEFNDCLPEDPGGDPNPPPPPPPPDPNIQYITYRGIRPSDPHGTQPLDNPERGFRFGYSMYATNFREPWHNVDYTNLSYYIDQHEAARANSKVRLAVIYFYLTDLLHTDISAAALANMQHIFDHIKNKGFKVILRFAYRVDDNSDYEELEDISRHLAQVRDFLYHNESLIHVVQAGFVGAWGEWHGSGLDGWPKEQNVVIRKLLATVPPSRKIQVRETSIKNNAAGAFSGFIHYTYYGQGHSGYESHPALTPAELDRIGFHNDYFILDQGTSAQVGWDYAWPHADFFQVQQQGPNTTVDGEMPNDAEYTLTPSGSLGGWYAARRMRAHGYTSFNILPNYDRNISNWANYTVHPSQFRNDNTLVTDDYFLNEYGQETGRSGFEYVRDHLGYRFQLRNGEIPRVVSVNATATFKFTIKNFGFSKMINSRRAYLVLIDANNNVREIPTGYNARDWYPTYSQYDGVHQVVQPVHIDNSYAPGHYRVGLWLPDESNELKYNTAYAVKLANGNMEWWKDASNRYLINILGALDIQ
jgi:hypothetical protein